MKEEPKESINARATLRYLDEKITDLVNSTPNTYEVTDAVLIRLFCRHLIYVMMANSTLPLTTKVDMIMNRLRLALKAPVVFILESELEPEPSKHKA